jgi:hypothetical protein
VRARLRKHPKATAAITIRVRDGAGNETKLSRSVKARRWPRAPRPFPAARSSLAGAHAHAGARGRYRGCLRWLR